MRFVDPRKTPFVAPRDRGELPHLHKPGGFYFVTYRLLDAVVPSQQRKQTPCESTRGEELEPEQLLYGYDPPVTMGSCVLRRMDVAKLVQDAFLHFDNVRYQLIAWCVMPNHVHVLFAPTPGHSPPMILQSWKGFTAREINRLLGRSGPLWERESFDHLVRTERSLKRFVKYIEANPVAASLCAAPEDWHCSSAGTAYKPTAGQV